MLKKAFVVVLLGVAALWVCQSDAIAAPKGKAKAKKARRDRDNNPPGRKGGPGTNWENPPGPKGGPGASPDRHKRHQRLRRLPKQKRQAVNALIRECRKQVKAVRKNADLTTRQKREAIRALVKNTRAAIREVLGSDAQVDEVVADEDLVADPE